MRQCVAASCCRQLVRRAPLQAYRRGAPQCGAHMTSRSLHCPLRFGNVLKHTPQLRHYVLQKFPQAVAFGHHLDSAHAAALRRQCRRHQLPRLGANHRRPRVQPANARRVQLHVNTLSPRRGFCDRRRRLLFDKDDTNSCTFEFQKRKCSQPMRAASSSTSDALCPRRRLGHRWGIEFQVTI